MNGLVENTIILTENEKRFKQPKYFHTDENMSVRDWYKAAYPTDTWGAEQIPEKLTFKYCRTSDGDIFIKYTIDGDWHHFYPDSVLCGRLYKEINVNEGLSFGYTIEG